MTIFQKPTRLQPTDIAWIALGGYVIGCNLLLPEQLSVTMGRYLLERRRTTEIGLLLVYLHLSNRVPPWLDPLHLLFAWPSERRRNRWVARNAVHPVIITSTIAASQPSWTQWAAPANTSAANHNNNSFIGEGYRGRARAARR